MSERAMKPEKVEVGQRRRHPDGTEYVVERDADRPSFFRRRLLSGRLGVCTWTEKELECNALVAPAPTPVVETPRDWARWLPPGPLPRRFDYGDIERNESEQEAGTIWAACWDFMGCVSAHVFRVDRDGGTAGEVLATRGKKPKLGPFDSCLGYSVAGAVLVQDVGQPEPTPPEVLYGRLPPVTQGPAKWCSFCGGSGQIRGGISYGIPDPLRPCPNCVVPPVTQGEPGPGVALAPDLLEMQRQLEEAKRALAENMQRAATPRIFVPARKPFPYGRMVGEMRALDGTPLSALGAVKGRRTSEVVTVEPWRASVDDDHWIADAPRGRR